MRILDNDREVRFIGFESKYEFGNSLFFDLVEADAGFENEQNIKGNMIKITTGECEKEQT